MFSWKKPAYKGSTALVTGLAMARSAHGTFARPCFW